MTFLGTVEHEERMLRHFRKVQKRSGIKFPPLPRYVSPGLPPAYNTINVRTPK